MLNLAHESDAIDRVDMAAGAAITAAALASPPALSPAQKAALKAAGIAPLRPAAARTGRQDRSDAPSGPVRDASIPTIEF
jgi:hypothetical protein